MSPEAAEEYTASLGQIVAGSWRQIAWADRQGIPAALGMTTRDWVEQRLGGYVRLAVPERREAVAELVGNGMTQREAADVLGVSQKTVDRDLKPESSDSNGDADQCSHHADESSDSPEPDPEVERRRAHREAIERHAERLRKFISGWFTFSTLDANPDREEVLEALAPPDRHQLADITERITWTKT